MSDDPRRPPIGDGLSVCLYCGSSDSCDPAFLAAAAEFGRILAAEGVRLVYGGGGIGLMGAAAKAAHGAGGAVLGVMPKFLRRREVIYDDVETIVVETMHERKRIMFEQSDAFAVFPGGVGLLEEVVEVLSWRRLGLHAKPIVLLDQDGFWDPLLDLLSHTVQTRFSPPETMDLLLRASSAADVLPTIRAALPPLGSPTSPATTLRRL